MHVPLSLKERKIASGEIKLSLAKLAELMQHNKAHQKSLEKAFM